jgi:hypothetical protein
LLCARPEADPQEERYRLAVAEIIRGVQAVSGLQAEAAAPGWVAVACESAVMARWLAEAIERENVEVRVDGVRLLLPVGADYRLEGEIKSVITVVAKTTDYWRFHLPPEVKQTLMVQAQLAQVKDRLTGWLGRWRRGPADERP